MNAIFLSKRNLGILLFAVGILLSTGLTFALTWAGYEAESYGFERMLGGERLDGLICPAFMTYHETGMIRVQVDNSSKMAIEPMLRIDTSTRGMPDSAQMQLKVEPGETRQFEQPVTSNNIDLIFFIFAKAYRFPAAHSMSTSEAACGIFVLDVPFLDGRQILYLWLAFGLIFTLFGFWMWVPADWPASENRAINTVKVLAVMALTGLFVSIQGIWFLGVVFLILTLLMLTALLSFPMFK